mmetsp:Transcript_43526/g.100187  ORF Transcript_43526/g.100187 Transcript_43526/m.100187 type:complete len:153 (+) Transcript_43526:70-528(+)
MMAPRAMLRALGRQPRTCGHTMYASYEGDDVEDDPDIQHALRSIALEESTRRSGTTEGPTDSSIQTSTENALKKFTASHGTHHGHHYQARGRSSFRAVSGSSALSRGSSSSSRRSSKMRGKSSHKTVTWTANTYVLEIGDGEYMEVGATSEI